MTQTDPTTHGLPITHDPQVKYRDVFDFAYQQWLADQQGDQQGELDCAAKVETIREFIDKARQLFTANQPIGQDFMSPALALRFQDGSILQFCDTVTIAGMGGNAGSQDVSKMHPVRGKGTTVPSPSWDVTGK